MARSPSSSNDPYASIGAAPVADPYAEIGGDPYAAIAVEASPYSEAGIALQRQTAVQSEARRRQLREEADIAAATPVIGVGIRAPFGGRELARFDLPEEASAFVSEAVKSSPSTAAGLAAASAATPLASRLGSIPGPIGLAARGIPLAAGGIAAIGTRLAQEEYLPQVLPEQLEQAYQVSSELAARNPTAAMLGQIAGAAPFFRPGLPIGAEGGARLAVPAITGAIGGGIEGAQQISSGEFAPERLAVATLGSALLNRETALGARVGPNLVLPNIAARGVPSELDIVGRTLREPVLPGVTDIVPAELDAMRQAQAISSSEQAASVAAGERSVANLEAGIDAERVRRLGERMAGVNDPGLQLQILDQEIKLAGDALTQAEQRAGLDMKIMLKQQIEQQKALETAARAEQTAVKEQQRAMEQAQAGIAEAAAAPEIPKSQQILTEAAKPPPLANVATEVATQTKQSPYALQGALNQMTAPPATVAPPVPAAGQIEPVNIGPRDASVSAGTGVPTAAETRMLAEQQRLVDEYLGRKTEGPVPEGQLQEAAAPESVPVIRQSPRYLNNSQTLSSQIEKGDYAFGVFFNGTSNEQAIGKVVRSSKDSVTIERPDSSKVKLSGVVGRFEGDGIAEAKAWFDFGVKNPEIIKARPPSPGRETITLDNDIPVGKNNSGEQLYDRADGSRYRMKEGRPDFGGDLSPVEAPRPATAELRLNNADLGMTPVASLSAKQKLAELQAGGVKTYAGKPIEDANPAQLSNALGKLRRGQLERGAVSARALTPIAGAASGGTAAAALTEQQPGETDEEFQSRRLRNIGLGAAYGAVGGAGINALGSAVRASRRLASVKAGAGVPLPDVEPGQGIRRTAEKVIINKSYPEQLRTILSEDPEIIYEKISRNRIRDLTQGATDEELTQMLSSPDPNLRIGALIQQANRAAVTPGMEAEGARLMREVSKNFTSPAQLLGMGSLVESPQAMVQAVEDALNLPGTAKEKVRTMSDAVKKKLFDLSDRNIRAEQRHARAQRAARDNLDDVTAAELKAAELELGASKKMLADYTKDILPEDMGQIASKIIKGNLLGPLSFAKNMFGNVMWQSALRGAESVATGLDAVYSKITGRPRSVMLGIPTPSVDELKALGAGVRVASKELLTGPSEQSYIKTEVQRGFHPLRAMVQVFSGLPVAEEFMAARGIASLPVRQETGKVAASDRAKKLIEATLGISPEASFRMLNLGDKPVRLVTEARLLSEAADLKGLKGSARAKFMALPDADTMARIEAEGRGGIMAQRNPLAQKVGKIFDSWMVDLAESLGAGDVPYLKELNKITGTLQFPFREFPANFASNALNFAMPPVAMARAILQAKNGNRREAMRNMGEAAMGMMFYAAADYLWENGLISPPLDPRDKKRRQAQYEMGASRVNVSGIDRMKNGEDPKYRLGDTTMDWTTIGPPAASLYVYTRRRALEEAKSSRTGDEVQIPKLTGAMLDAAGAANFSFDQSFLSGTSAFIDALQDWETFGDRFTQNTFRAITAIPVPATAESLAKTQYKFIPEMKGDTLPDTLKNVWDFKVMELPENARSNLKRDMWGDPIRRTPEGRNPYLYQFLDVTRAEAKPADPFKQKLLEIYQQTHSTDTYPSLVDDTLSLGGPGGTTSVELYADDYDDLQQLVGAYRRQFAEQVVSNPRFSDPETIPEQKLLALKEAYAEGMKIGKQAFLSQEGARVRYPELFGLPSVPGKSRVIARDIKARGRLRMEREAR